MPAKHKWMWTYRALRQCCHTMDPNEASQSLSRALQHSCTYNRGLLLARHGTVV